MVSPQVPLVLHLLLADLAGELPAHGVHVEDVLLQVELVAEHPLAVLTHPRLPALPGGTQEGSHLQNRNVKEIQLWNFRCDGRITLMMLICQTNMFFHLKCAGSKVRAYIYAATGHMQ